MTWAATVTTMAMAVAMWRRLFRGRSRKRTSRSCSPTPECAIKTKNAATPGSRADPPCPLVHRGRGSRARGERKPNAQKQQPKSKFLAKRGFGWALSRARHASWRADGTRTEDSPRAINATANQPNPIAMLGAGGDYMATILIGHQVLLAAMEVAHHRVMASTTPGST